MSGSQSRYVPKLSDRDLIKAFERVAKKYNEVVTRHLFQDSFGELDDGALAVLRKHSGFNVQRAYIAVGSTTWSVTRLPADDAKSTNYDKLSLSWDRNNPPDRLLTLEISGELDIALSRPVAAAGADVSSLASHSDILTALESATAQLLTESAEQRRVLDAAYLEKERELIGRAGSRSKCISPTSPRL